MHRELHLEYPLWIADVAFAVWRQRISAAESVFYRPMKIGVLAYLESFSTDSEITCLKQLIFWSYVKLGKELKRHW